MIAAPFERSLLVLPWPRLVLTSVELVILGALAAAVIAWWSAPHPQSLVGRPEPISGDRASREHAALLWRTPLTWPGLTVVAIMFGAALAAPAFTGNALRFTGRLFITGLIFLLTVNAILTERAARLVVGVWVAVAAVVAGVAVLEAAHVQPVMDALTFFRPGFHVVGGQLRATSTLVYPTVTSMYLEVPFALGLWLLVDAIDRRRFALAGLCFAILLLIGAGIVATFTRAGLMSLALSIAVVGGFRLWRTRRVDGAQVALLALAAALVAVVFASRSPDRLLTRLSTEGSQAWYGATYQAPGELRFVPGGRYAVPVTLVNTGRLEWSSGDYPPFALSYHWVVAGSSNVVQFNGLRTPFPTPVAPGSAVSMNAVVIAPANPGWYDLVWDVVHEYRAWLSTENVLPGRTRVRVEGPPTRLRADAMPRLPAAAVRPPRSTLWQAALQIAAEHPVTGIGPDNFRLAYGTYVGLPRWDTRVHANSLYLEVLAGAGVPGLAALLCLIAAAGRAIVRRWQATPLPLATASAAAFAVWATVAGHGLVDTFLAFTPTYVTFAVAAGLALAPGLAKTETVPGTISRTS